MLQPHVPHLIRWQFVRHRYVPLGIIWSPGSYPTVAAGYDDKFAALRKWVLARLAWMEGQLKEVRSQRSRCQAHVDATTVCSPSSCATPAVQLGKEPVVGLEKTVATAPASTVGTDLPPAADLQHHCSPTLQRVLVATEDACWCRLPPDTSRPSWCLWRPISRCARVPKATSLQGRPPSLRRTATLPRRCRQRRQQTLPQLAAEIPE